MDENDPVNVETLHIDDCPDWEDPGHAVRPTLDAYEPPGTGK
jgi:hypothetical protein